jgi:hypothetical protein
MPYLSRLKSIERSGARRPTVVAAQNTVYIGRKEKIQKRLGDENEAEKAINLMMIVI